MGTRAQAKSALEANANQPWKFEELQKVKGGECGAKMVDEEFKNLLRRILESDFEKIREDPRVLDKVLLSCA